MPASRSSLLCGRAGKERVRRGDEEETRDGEEDTRIGGEAAAAMGEGERERAAAAMGERAATSCPIGGTTTLADRPK
jgi:hypothetical protein